VTPAFVALFMRDPMREGLIDGQSGSIIAILNDFLTNKTMENDFPRDFVCFDLEDQLGLSTVDRFIDST
jgi:hypothetical protein